MKEFILKNYGLIGESLGHSMSEYIHKDLWGYDYKLQNLRPDQVEKFLKEKNFKGVNVTIPYKLEVIKYLDGLSDLARKIGSVNTIKNDRGKLLGYNTDYLGFNYLLKKSNIGYKNKKVLILGSGGASKMAEKYCQDAGAKNIAIISRSGSNNYNNLEKFKSYDAIINATPLGMYPNNLVSPLDLDIFSNLESVVDLIYNPLSTKLILDAKSKNIKTGSGLDMLVAQAFYSAEIFLGKKLDQAIIDKTIKLVKRKMRNIIFVGMPGSGKTRMGQKLAQDISYKFIDIDSEVRSKEKMSIEDIFKYKKEGYFRKIESEILEKFSKDQAQVISTGGGSVISKKNRDMIMQNSYVIFLNRKLDRLARNGRPLSKDHKALESLYRERISYYRELADIEIIVEESIEKTFEKIKEELIRNEVIGN